MNLGQMQYVHLEISYLYTTILAISTYKVDLEIWARQFDTQQI